MLGELRPVFWQPVVTENGHLGLRVDALDLAGFVFDSGVYPPERLRTGAADICWVRRSSLPTALTVERRKEGVYRPVRVFLVVDEAAPGGFAFVSDPGDKPQVDVMSNLAAAHSALFQLLTETVAAELGVRRLVLPSGQVLPISMSIVVAATDIFRSVLPTSIFPRGVCPIPAGTTDACALMVSSQNSGLVMFAPKVKNEELYRYRLSLTQGANNELVFVLNVFKKDGTFTIPDGDSRLVEITPETLTAASASLFRLLTSNAMVERGVNCVLLPSGERHPLGVATTAPPPGAAQEEEAASAVRPGAAALAQDGAGDPVPDPKLFAEGAQGGFVHTFWPVDRFGSARDETSFRLDEGAWPGA